MAEIPGAGRRSALRAGAAALIPWPAPVAALVLALGQDTVFAGIAFFFSKKAVVTFGGTGAVPGYVAQVAVGTCLRPGGTLDGLGASETTPGPLMVVLQFAGFLGVRFMVRLRANRPPSAHLTAAPASVVVVILNPAIWFAIHAVWRKVLRIEAGPLCRRSFPFLAPSTGGQPGSPRSLVAVFRRMLGMTTVLAGAAGHGTFDSGTEFVAWLG